MVAISSHRTRIRSSNQVLKLANECASLLSDIELSYHSLADELSNKLDRLSSLRGLGLLTDLRLGGLLR